MTDLARLRDNIAQDLLDMERMFKPGIKLTLLARRPGHPDQDVIVTADELADVAAMVRRSADREGKPLQSWTCFHCGETFTDEESARTHFGFDASADPGCRIKTGAETSLLKALRESERDAANAWAAIHEETTDAAKAYAAQTARHHRQLQAAEEAGYERGLVDARAQMAVLA
jgi:hypothetical protein